MSCPACGSAVPEGARFCPACGHGLQAPMDERRVVTVLFGDLVGFTTLSESLDPEHVKNIVDGCFEGLANDIRTFGGHVDKIIGDAIVALFGTPLAHEDDAERAVRAALRMQQTLAEHTDGVRMRIGINTGEVLVGALRAGGDVTAMGDVVNIASRLQTAASPGQVLVGSSTRAATRDVIRYESLGPLQARGRDEPVEAWAAVEPVAPPGRRPRKTRSPLVGRDAELGLLRHALETVRTRRRAHLVLLNGEAGVGKSRLAEDAAALAKTDFGALVLQGRCAPYGEANVWWPVAEALRQACAIDPADPADVSAAKCRAAVATATGLADPLEIGRVADGLLYLMGDETVMHDVEPSRAREDAVRALVLSLESIARARPVLLVVSDLHWAHELVLDLLDRLLERLSGLPFVLLATTRPGLQERWTPRPGRHNVLLMNLEPLDREAAGDLLESLMGEAPPPDVRDLLIDRSGGNPFFLEELVALLGESGALRGGAGLAAELPATLRGLVAARLDALSPRERAAVEDAAVLGRTGPIDALGDLAAARGTDDVAGVLEELVAKDLLVVDQSEFAFKTDLVREVAYGTLTKAERARRHAMLAQWLDERARRFDRTDEYLEQVAHHFANAADLASELGRVEGVPADIGEQALQALERAATRADWREMYAVSVHLFEHALSLAPPEGPRRWGLLLGRARARAALRDLAGAREDANRVLAEAEEGGDRAAYARALTTLGEVENKEGASEVGLAVLERAVRIWREVGDRQGTADALRWLGFTHLFRGELDAAQAAISEALAAYREVADRRGQAWALQNLAWIAFNRGDVKIAEERLAESSSMFLEVGDVGGAAWAFGLLGWVRLFQGNLEEAERIGEGAVEGSRESGDRWGYGIMSVLLSAVRMWQGRTSEALERGTEARRVFQAIGDRWGEFMSLQPVVRALVSLGRLHEAFETVGELVSLSETLPDPNMRWMAAGVAAAAAIQAGEPERAMTLALPDVEPTLGEGERTGELLTVMGMSHLQQGRVEEALTCLEAAVRDEDNPGLLANAGAALALAYSAAGRPAHAIDRAGLVESLPSEESSRGHRTGHGTYLDRLTAASARGLACAQRGRDAEARAAFEAAVATADGTGDRLWQALIRLAHGRALETLGSPEAEEVLREARDRLAAMGAAASGWDAAFTLAATGGARRIPAGPGPY